MPEPNPEPMVVTLEPPRLSGGGMLTSAAIAVRLGVLPASTAVFLITKKAFCRWLSRLSIGIAVRIAVRPYVPRRGLGLRLEGACDCGMRGIAGLPRAHQAGPDPSACSPSSPSFSLLNHTNPARTPARSVPAPNRSRRTTTAPCPSPHGASSLSPSSCRSGSGGTDRLPRARLAATRSGMGHRKLRAAEIAPIVVPPPSASSSSPAPPRRGRPPVASGQTAASTLPPPPSPARGRAEDVGSPRFRRGRARPDGRAPAGRRPTAPSSWKRDMTLMMAITLQRLLSSAPVGLGGRNGAQGAAPTPSVGRESRRCTVIQIAATVIAGLVAAITGRRDDGDAAPVLIQALLGMAYTILAEAGLSFLGVGVNPPTPTWGGMLQRGVPLPGRPPVDISCAWFRCLHARPRAQLSR